MNTIDGTQHGFIPTDDSPFFFLRRETYTHILAAWRQIQSHFMVLTRGNMENELLRLITFLHFPQHTGQDIRILAIAGFYYYGESDIVVCYCCGLWIRNWSPSDDPWDIHCTLSVSCAFIRNNREVNRPYYGITEGGLRQLEEIIQVLPANVSGVFPVTPGFESQSEISLSTARERTDRHDNWILEQIERGRPLPDADLPVRYGQVQYSSQQLDRAHPHESNFDNNDTERRIVSIRNSLGASAHYAHGERINEFSASLGVDWSEVDASSSMSNDRIQPQLHTTWIDNHPDIHICTTLVTERELSNDFSCFDAGVENVSSRTGMIDQACIDEDANDETVCKELHTNRASNISPRTLSGSISDPSPYDYSHQSPTLTCITANDAKITVTESEYVRATSRHNENNRSLGGRHTDAPNKCLFVGEGGGCTLSVIDQKSQEKISKETFTKRTETLSETDHNSEVIVFEHPNTSNNDLQESITECKGLRNTELDHKAHDLKSASTNPEKTTLSRNSQQNSSYRSIEINSECSNHPRHLDGLNSNHSVKTSEATASDNNYILTNTGTHELTGRRSTTLDSTVNTQNESNATHEVEIEAESALSRNTENETKSKEELPTTTETMSDTHKSRAEVVDQAKARESREAKHFEPNAAVNKASERTAEPLLTSIETVRFKEREVSPTYKKVENKHSNISHTSDDSCLRENISTAGGRQIEVLRSTSECNISHPQNTADDKEIQKSNTYSLAEENATKDATNVSVNPISVGKGSADNGKTKQTANSTTADIHKEESSTCIPLHVRKMKQSTQREIQPAENSSTLHTVQQSCLKSEHLGTKPKTKKSCENLSATDVSGNKGFIHLDIAHGDYKPNGPQNYASYEARSRSFRNNSVRKCQQFADAGFYHTGIDGYIRCFSCGREFKSSKLENNLWIIHAKESPNCEYILKRKGQDFMETVKQGKTVVLKKYNDIFEEDHISESQNEKGGETSERYDGNRATNQDLLEGIVFNTHL